MMNWYGYGMSGWGVLLMAIVTLALLGLLVAAIVGLARTAGPRADTGSSDGAARSEELLAERYARGEIDEQDYRARLAVLRERPTPSRR